MKLTKSRSIVNFLGIPLIVFLVFMGEYFFLFFISVVNFFCLREFYLLPRSEKIYPQFIIGYIISFLILLLNFFQYDKIIFFTFFDFFRPKHIACSLPPLPIIPTFMYNNI